MLATLKVYYIDSPPVNRICEPFHANLYNQTEMVKFKLGWQPDRMYLLYVCPAFQILTVLQRNWHQLKRQALPSSYKLKEKKQEETGLEEKIKEKRRKTSYTTP